MACLSVISASHLCGRQALEPFAIDECTMVNLCFAEMLTWRECATARFFKFDLVLLFAGEMTAATEGFKRGMRVGTFDISRDPWENSNTLMGCLYMTFLVYCVKPGGIVWCSPECRSFLSFLSRDAFLRLMDGFTILGDWDKEPVRHGNMYAVFLSWLLFMATLRSVAWAWENPLNSLVWQMPCVSNLCTSCNASRIVTSLGSFGGRSQKTLEVYTTLPLDVCTTYLIRQGKRSREYTKLYSESSGWTNGARKRLKSSAAYPLEFAQAIARCADELSPGPRFTLLNESWVGEAWDLLKLASDELPKPVKQEVKEESPSDVGG